MATRKFRLAEFNQGSPPTGEQFLLLCEDHNGTYTLPFRCEWRDGAWYGVEKTKPWKQKWLAGGRGGIKRPVWQGCSLDGSANTSDAAHNPLPTLVVR